MYMNPPFYSVSKYDTAVAQLVKVIVETPVPPE